MRPGSYRSRVIHSSSRPCELSHVGGSRNGITERFERSSILIGRGDANDVALDPFEDSTVSTHHAEIRREGGGFVLYDMGSLNGTWLNGKAVRRATLTDRDEIRLGPQGPAIRFHSTMDSSNDAREFRDVESFEHSRRSSRATMIVVVVLVVAALAIWWLTR